MKYVKGDAPPDSLNVSVAPNDLQRPVEFIMNEASRLRALRS